ncbi:MAG: peptidase M49 [Bryobacteraceae bacterium]
MKLLVAALLILSTACSSAPPAETKQAPAADTRPYLLERVDDAAVVQLYADGFEQLPIKEKLLIWHLYQAAIAGRDIYYDQRYAHALDMRDTFEAVLAHPAAVDKPTLDALQKYAKLFWINTGPYNNLTERKFVLDLAPEAFAAAAKSAATAGASFPTRNGETLDALLERLKPMFFAADYEPSVTVKTPEKGLDILTASHNNLYQGVALKDLTGFKEKYALNSRLVKINGKLVEEPYKVGGLYDAQLREIITHLEAAAGFATEPMAKALNALAQWYRTGEEADRKAYDIAWVADTASNVDTINGFTEVYLDARGVKGSWESVVFFVDQAKTGGIQKLAADAQWFEDHMPWDAKYRKTGVKGITANAISVVVETGDSGPVTPIGINLPNDSSVREQYGSKSVSLSNVVEAYDKSSDPGLRSEFSWSPEEAARTEKWGSLASELVTNMHEAIGHASGKLDAKLNGKPELAIKEFYSALEEGRADLVGLYFLADPKLAELGLVPAADQAEIVKAEYESYTRNALVQLRRVRQGTTIEEDHMRNRQMVVRWLMANTKAIESKMRDNKTFLVMTDPVAFRAGVAKLLAEVQRIKSEGDFPAAKKLFGDHGIHFDPKLRDEIVARVESLKLPSYTGFVMPRLEAVKSSDGSITDVKVSYPKDLTAQMLEYAAATKTSRDTFRAK